MSALSAFGGEKSRLATPITLDAFSVTRFPYPTPTKKSELACIFLLTLCQYISINLIMGKRRPFTLSIDADLVDQIKIQAIREKRTVSDITEELYRKHLKRKGRAKR